MTKSFSPSTARLAMILSLPEIEFEVMSVSSSIEAIVLPCAPVHTAIDCAKAPFRATSTASRRIRATMLVGSRKRNT